MRKANLIYGYATKERRYAATACAVDTVLRLFVRKRTYPPDVRRVLVSKIDHLGDMILLAWVMPLVRNTFPDAGIDLLAGSWSEKLVECIPSVDRVILYDSFFHNRSSNPVLRITRDLRSFRSAVNIIRKGKYQVGLEMRAGMVNGIPLMRCGGVEYIVGYASGGFGPLLDRIVPWEPAHEVGKFMKILEQAGLPAAHKPKFSFRISENSLAEAKNLIGTGRTVVLHPGGGRGCLWPASSWKKLAQHLHHGGWSIILTGSGQERAFAEDIIAGLPALNLCGKLPIMTFAGVLKQVHLVIGLDSFATHLSSSLNTPTAVIFRPDSSEEFLPYGSHVGLHFDSSADDVIRKLAPLGRPGQEKRT